MPFPRSTLIALPWLVALVAASSAAEGVIDKALEQSQQTGIPILAVAGSKT